MSLKKEEKYKRVEQMVEEWNKLKRDVKILKILAFFIAAYFISHIILVFYLLIAIASTYI